MIAAVSSKLIRASYWLVLAGYFFATILSFLGPYFWGFELLSHFRLQLFAGGLLIAAIVTLSRAGWPSLLVVLPALALNASPLVFLNQTAPPVSLVHSGGRDLSVMSVNFRYSYGDSSALKRVIDADDPEIVVLTEVYSRRQELMTLFGHQYPHQFYAGADHSSAMLVLSRLPFRSKSAIAQSDGKYPVADLEICQEILSAKNCFYLIAMHTPRPGPNGQTYRRNQMLQKAATIAASKDTGRTIVVGDFNITRWSADFTALLNRGGLSDSKASVLAANTWISRVPLFGLSIDHILYGDGFFALNRRVGPSIGSDHLPLTVDFVFASPE